MSNNSINNQSGYYQVGTKQPHYGEPLQPSVAAATALDVTGYSEDFDPVQGRTDENVTFVLLILGFFLGGFVTWFIAHMLYRNSASPKARTRAKVSGILGVLSLASVLLVVVAVGLYLLVMVYRICGILCW